MLRHPRILIVLLIVGLFGVSSLAQSEKAPPQRNVAIFVHDGVELLDFAGPAEVFANANANGRRAFNVYTVAPTTQPVATQQSVTVVPQYSIDNCPAPAILVIPGGATNRLTEDARVMKWIKRTAQDSELTMTVCTGAFALAENGLLDGLEATTHYSALAGLRREHPQIQVRDDVRVVDNGKFVTTAGISAGIDGALHVVSRLCGEESAWMTARYMEYRWEPPALPADATRHQKLTRDALSHRVFGRWLEAVDALSDLAQVQANDPDVHLQLAEAQLRLERFDDAIASAMRARDLGAENPRALTLIARGQLGAGDFKNAVESYKKAIAAGADGATNHYNLACCHARLGQKEEALRSLEVALARGPYMRRQAERDEDFANLRDDQRFTLLVNSQ